MSSTVSKHILKDNETMGRFDASYGTSVSCHNTTQSAWCGTSKACIRRGQLDDVNMDLQNAQNTDRALGELWESVLHSSNAPNDNTQL